MGYLRVDDPPLGTRRRLECGRSKPKRAWGYAGEYIWKSESEWAGPFADRNAFYMSRGSLMWDGSKKNGFCKECWVIWRDSFGWVADMEEVSNETRELATLAYARMRWIEENVPRS